MQKIYVIKGGVLNKDISAKKEKVAIHYCGYLEFEDDVDIQTINLWHFCNWFAWNTECPKECKNLLIGYCNSDVAFFYNGAWYNHFMKKMPSFDSCYKAMVKKTDDFNTCWPIINGFMDNIKSEDDIKIIKSKNDFMQIINDSEN